MLRSVFDLIAICFLRWACACEAEKEIPTKYQLLPFSLYVSCSNASCSWYIAYASSSRDHTFLVIAVGLGYI